MKYAKIYQLENGKSKFLGVSENFVEDREIFPVIAGFVGDIQIIEYIQEGQVHFIWLDKLTGIEYIAVCVQGKLSDFYKMTLLQYARYNLVEMPQLAQVKGNWKGLLR